MLPEIGKTVDEKYVIERQLGQGGMAVVFAAHHTVLDRPVAMKVLSPELPRTPQLVQRFLSEARAAARVESTHVARIFDAGTLDDGSPFIVMERLEGCDLDELLSARKQLPIGDAVDHVLQALHGLAHAHMLGVIHRDLKPANLFLARQPDSSALIKILDFGIAKLVDEARQMARGQTMGSPTYMSPEQVRDAELVDPRADIWSIGIVLYELLTGRTPFDDADGVGETIAAVLKSTPSSSRTLRDEIPAGLDAAIMRCLRQNPDERFDDVSQLAAAIAPFGTGSCSPIVEAIEQTLRQSGRFVTSTSVARAAPVVLAPVRVAFTEQSEDAVAYLYGDGAPSSLQANFFPFLESALDCIAELLVLDDAITQSREDVVRLPREAVDELERLKDLIAMVKEAIALAPKGRVDSPTARIGATTIANLEALFPDEVTKVKAQLELELNAISGKERAARYASLKAFESLLLRHDLPGSILSFELRRGAAQRYAARLKGVVDYGFRWDLEIDIPSDHALAHVAKLEKLAQIEVQAPELTGWLRKEIKLRPQRLDRYYLTELTIGMTSMSMKLRTEAVGDDGYDVEVDVLMSRFQLVRPTTSDAAYDVSESDATKLAALHKTLLSVARDLASDRSRLVEASLDDSALCEEHDPRRVVERMIAVISPIMREIALHSSSATELALKRLTADNRREEIFVSKASLLARLASVPDRLRPILEPLARVLEMPGTRGSPSNDAS